METNSSWTSSTYFAAAAPDEIGEALQGKVDFYYAYLTSSSLVDLWRKSFYTYYGLLPDTALAGFGMFGVGGLIAKGSSGELVGIFVNQFRNLILHQLSNITSSRPALECRAVNSDAASIAAAKLGDGVLDFYVREKDIEKLTRGATEMALVMGESFLRFDWNANGGAQYGVDDNGRPIYNGDLIARIYNPFDVIRDTAAISPQSCTWHICHDVQSKFDLAAKYPEIADEIISTNQDITSARRFIDATKIIPAAGIGARDTDLIDIFEFLHPPSDALPQGRYVIFVQGGLVLFDGPYPFSKPCLHRISGSDVIGAPFGWTLAFDLLGLQELLNKLYSTVASNQMASGIQNYWSPPGNEIGVTQIAGGLTLLESVTKPEVLMLCQTPPEIFNFITKLESVMETLSGVSAVNRGQTPENLKSGSALAFVASQAVTFSDQLTQSYNELLEGVGDSIISLLHDFGTTPRLAFIAGKFNRPIMREFVGKDLDGVDRVVVDATNSVSKTTAGKIQIAQDLLQANLLRNAREYLTVVETGQLDPILDSEMSEIILVHAENEDMMMGKMPAPLLIDDAKLHILEHRALLANPDSRRNPELVQIVLKHIQDHVDLTNTPQYAPMAALLGVPPIPDGQATPQPPPGAMPQQGPTPPNGMRPGTPPPGPAGMPAQMNAMPPEQQHAAKIHGPNMPNLPKNAGPQAQQNYAQLKAGMQK